MKQQLFQRVKLFTSILFLFSFGMACLHAKPFINLEDKTQDFVLETKQINISGYPGAFNASVIRWQGKFLLCFRVRNAAMISTFQMGFVWLDDDFNPVSTPVILRIIDHENAAFSQNQDPRLISLNNRLYILYSNFIKVGDITTRRMFVAEVYQGGPIFFIKNPKPLHPFQGWSKRWEKNWTPFVHQDTLLLAYSLLPHRILQPSLLSGECIDVANTESDIDWQWGELRGGTPAFLEGNEYVAFFHSSQIMATSHSHGIKMQHYFMGAYTFSAQSPFAITRMSPEPIVGKHFYEGPAYNTWKPLRVVFPMGCVANEKYVWVTYGRQDFEIWVVKLDKKGLFKSLKPCPLKNAKESLMNVTTGLEEANDEINCFRSE